MDIMNLAKGLIAKKLGGNSDAIGGVLDSLLGDGDKMDIGSLVSGFQSKGLGDVASSWLGDGENANRRRAVAEAGHKDDCDFLGRAVYVVFDKCLCTVLKVHQTHG